MDQLLSALKAAAEPTRLRLLLLCARCDLTVSELTRVLGQSQPRVSRHLKLLCEAGLLDRHREGSWVYFRLSAAGTVAGLARTLVDAIPRDDAVVALDLDRLESVKQARATLAADYFRRNAAEWDAIRSLYVDDAEVERRLLGLLPEGGGDLLDIGTGTGRIVEIAAPHVGRAVGIDLSHEMLLVARSNLERAGLDNGFVRHADMYQLPFAGGAFDVVTIHQVLHFADRPAAAIAEAARVLRPGGRMIIVDFESHGEERLRDEHAHRWLGFSPADIIAWCEAAGLEAGAPLSLPGRNKTLTVGIWSALRPAGDVSAAA
ncbi:MAG: ArsR/SmtB family transcription factor [Alphaproteobacteria bacterium]